MIGLWPGKLMHIHVGQGKIRCFLVSTLVFLPFLFSLLLCLSCLIFSTLLPFILRLSFPSTWNRPLFFPVIKDTLPIYLWVHIFCIHSIHLEPRFEYSLPYGWTDESSIWGTHTGQVIPHFKINPHIELICGYKLWSLPFFLPPLNLKSINWWLWLEVSMTFFS